MKPVTELWAFQVCLAVGVVIIGNAEADKMIKVDKAAWLEAHNKLRRKEFASNMQEMVWDPALELLAREWGATCLYRHRPMQDRKHAAGYPWIGENLYIAYGSGVPSPQAVLENPYYGWHGEERKHWDFRTMSCQKGKSCEHFTQVVWANSCAVGCAIVLCDKLKLPESKIWTNAYYVVCNYGPSGNLRGQSPFSPGMKCSSCPGTCRNGLCPSRCKNGSRQPLPSSTAKILGIEGLKSGTKDGDHHHHSTPGPFKGILPTENHAFGCVDVKRGCAHHGSPACHNRIAYRGDWARTISGVDCIAWSEYDDGYPSLGRHNYCRNPDADASPWCYISVNGEISFDFCFPDCKNTPKKKKLELISKSESAAGHQSAVNGRRTISGITENTIEEDNRVQSPAPPPPRKKKSGVDIHNEGAINTLLEALKSLNSDGARSQETLKENVAINDGIDVGLTSSSTGTCVDSSRNCARLDSGLCDRQLDYTGSRNLTVSGKPCQKWTNQAPHKHGFEPNGNHNFCRIKGASAPWCFTTDSDTRWEYCFEICPDCVHPEHKCALHGLPICLNEEGYQGEHSRTLSGLECQRWSDQHPHEHDFPENGEHNYCRTKGSLAPWCFTTDNKTRWEFCFPPCTENQMDLPYAELRHGSSTSGVIDNLSNPSATLDQGARGAKPLERKTKTSTTTESPPTTTFDLDTTPDLIPDPTPKTRSAPGVRELVDPTPNVCVLERRGCAKRGRPGCTSENSLGYVGERQSTISGKLCQNWSSQQPHRHEFTHFGDHNYCRIEGSGAPWCYTNDRSKRWEFCFRECNDYDIMNPFKPLSECVLEKRLCAKRGSKVCLMEGSYQGNKDSTINGRPCQSWSAQTPHRHSFTDMGNHNFCRNTGDGAPWCLTEDSKVEWEYCFRECDEFDLNNPERPLEGELSGLSGRRKEAVEPNKTVSSTNPFKNDPLQPVRSTHNVSKIFTHPILRPGDEQSGDSENYLLNFCDEYDPRLPFVCKTLGAAKLCRHHGYQNVLAWDRVLDDKNETKTWTLGSLCLPKESEFGGCWRYGKITCVTTKTVETAGHIQQ